MSKRIRVIVPIPVDDSGVANRAAQLPSAKVSDGYQVDFEAVSYGAGYVRGKLVLTLGE